MKTRVKLTFPQDMIKEPAIFTGAEKYGVMSSIRRARVTDSAGEMVLELEGTREGLEKAIQTLMERGVEVELVAGDMVE